MDKNSKRNLERIAEILVRMVSVDDANERALLSSAGVLFLMEEMETKCTYRREDINVPDFSDVKL